MQPKKRLFAAQKVIVLSCIFLKILPLQPHSYIILGGKIQPGRVLLCSNVMGDMSALFTFNINSKSSFMQMTKRLQEEMQHLPFSERLTDEDVAEGKTTKVCNT